MLLPGGKRADALVAYVEDLIKQRGLNPGDRIATRDDLRDQTAASRATINEALRLLENRGRVTLRPGPGGGLFVAPVSPLVRFGQTLLSVNRDATLSVSDAIQLRDALEPLIATDAARNRTKTDIRELRALLDRVARSTGNPGRFFGANMRLHERIAKITPNPLLQGIYLSLASFIEYQATPPSVAGRDVRSHLEPVLRIHVNLVDAIASGDSKAARKLAEQHAAQLRRLSSEPRRQTLPLG